MSIRHQTELLGISRSSHYYKPKALSDDTLDVMSKIEKEYTIHPEKGVLSMVDFLRDLNITIGPKRVRRLMRKMGIEAIYRKPRLSKLG